MATVLERPETLPDEDEVRSAPLLRRPSKNTGLVAWLTGVDHKKVGILYGVTAMFFFVVGGAEALLIRLQLAQPEQSIVSADTFNQLFTMHGTTMIFLVVMPIGAAFMNYMAPLLIGARDVAFPRLNALSYWTFLTGGILLNSSWFLGGAPNGGWFGYTPNTSITYSPGHNIDFWIFGLLITGIASTVGAVNLIVTILNLRAPGMTLMRMPIFAWTTLITQFLLLFALPVITIALILLMFDRLFGANFFNPAAGGDPVLWQHLFWIFGHPEVYIMIIPAFGIVSEVLPVFSRKPIFGYPVIVFSTMAIGFMGWGVWAHHMFAVGLGPMAVSAFSIATMFIAVPTGVKIFNWTATMWGGSLKFATPMLFCIAFIAMFTIGGLSGVSHAISPHDRQQTDTYYIVAHFHYVLFGGGMFAFFGGLYYWWPKVFGHMLREGIGKVHFWLMFIGFNLAFGPMHILGLQGMPRRIPTYDDELGLNFWNLVSTIGAFTIGLSLLVFFLNVQVSRKAAKRRAVKTPPDPWDARTIEWSIPSPTPHYNFAKIPTIHSVDDFWHRKYGEDENGRLVRIAETADLTRGEEEATGEGVHLPSLSYFPLIIAVGLPVIAYGMIYKAWAVAIIGAVIVLFGIFGWAIEPSTEPHHPDEDGGHGDGHGDRELAPVGGPTAALGAGEGADGSEAAAERDASLDPVTSADPREDDQ